MRTLLLPILLLCLSGCGQYASKPLATDESCPGCVVVPPLPSDREILAEMPVSRAVPGTVSAPRQKTGDGEESNAVRFPQDASGALLLKLLQPKVTVSAIAERTRAPHRKAGPSRIEEPTGMLPVTFGQVPRLPPLGRRENLTPRIDLKETLAGAAAIPAVPTSVALPVGKKVKAERLDPASTPDLPTVAQPVSDRASLEDPTRASSLEAAIVAPIPERQTPAPFVRQTILDPFANRKTVQVTAPPEESAQPVSAAPKLPKP